MALLSALATEIAIPVCAVIGIMFSLRQWYLVWRHNSNNRDDPDREGVAPSDNDSQQGHDVALRINDSQQEDVALRQEVSQGDSISQGVVDFLSGELWYVVGFMVAFAILIFLFLGSVEGFSTQSRSCTSNMCKPALATAVSFLLGAFTSVLSGLLGMLIANYFDARTALEEKNGSFDAAFECGKVIGCFLAAFGLLMLYIAINLFKWYYGNDWEGLFEAITGYGLGGSSMALLGRASGGNYAKAAYFCAHAVPEIDSDFRLDVKNPGVIPKYVGIIVGDIAGMATDLFGSYAESTCAALVVASISSFGIHHDFTATCYPLLISSMDILVCLITTKFCKPTSRMQLILPQILMTFGIVIVSWIALPSSFTIDDFKSDKVVKSWQLSLCVAVGLWARLIVGFVSKYVPNNAASRLQDVATDMSPVLATVSIPISAAISIFVSSSFAATYRIAVAALGMLSTTATRMHIDAYGPIGDNANNNAEMPSRGALHAAASTTAATSKGIPIESAALVSVALFGAFLSRAAISPADVLTQKFFIGLIVGERLPYGFSYMTMKSVGRAGLRMVKEVREQLKTDKTDFLMGRKTPNYANIIRISTGETLWGVILPFAFVMFIPLFFGTVFGVEMLSGVLAGSLGSVVTIAILESTTGGAWNKGRGHIKDGASEYVDTHCRGDKKLGRIAQIGDTIGDSQKYTSGPSLNILIQLMAVESLVFAPLFASPGGPIIKFFFGRERTTYPL